MTVPSLRTIAAPQAVRSIPTSTQCNLRCCGTRGRQAHKAVAPSAKRTDEFMWIAIRNGYGYSWDEAWRHQLYGHSEITFSGVIRVRPAPSLIAAVFCPFVAAKRFQYPDALLSIFAFGRATILHHQEANGNKLQLFLQSDRLGIRVHRSFKGKG